ncbi:MAG: TIGR00296 family protein [archaeon]
MEIEKGKLLVKTAREKILAHLSGKKYTLKSVPAEFKRKMGVFVTLETHPARELRGCIGYPEPIFPLIDAILDAAVSAATRDPRFPPVSASEMEKITVEITVLTPPKQIKVSSPAEYPKKIKLGRDGLIAEASGFKGLLLPRVPVEWKWTVEEFLSHTCLKAGLPPDLWKSGKVALYSFQGELFAEESPGGNIIKKNIKNNL